MSVSTEIQLRLHRMIIGFPGATVAGQMAGPAIRYGTQYAQVPDRLNTTTASETFDWLSDTVAVLKLENQHRLEGAVDGPALRST